MLRWLEQWIEPQLCYVSFVSVGDDPSPPAQQGIRGEALSPLVPQEGLRHSKVDTIYLLLSKFLLT